MPSPSQHPTTRSRTGLFLSYRDSTVRSTRFSQRYKPDNHSAEEGQGLIAHSPAHDVVDLIITPKWFLHPPSDHTTPTHQLLSYRVDLADQVDLILVDVQAKSASSLLPLSTLLLTH